jgi:alkylation response protein AidB-like acyl-CoA dehydrogenase
MGDTVLDLVAARAAEVERSGRIPEDVLAELRGLGLNRLMLPVELGGGAAPPLELMETVERIAAVDGSTGWCAVIGGGGNVLGGYVPEIGAREIFADPDRPTATMFAPQGRIADGRLTGRWPFTSNCLHSDWIGLGALVDGELRIVFVRAVDLRIEHTWDSAGLRGTGSHHVSADGIPVASTHWTAFTDTPWAEGPLWRLPLSTVLPPLLAAVPLGIARGAVDRVAGSVTAVQRRGSLADDPVGLADLAAADARLHAARAGLHSLLTEAFDLAVREQAVSRVLQARAALACLHAVDTAVEVTATAHRLGGGAAAYAGSPLLRALNDVQAARQHILFGHHHLAPLGRILAGEDRPYPPLVY